jgi:hypothetical protein
MSPTTPPRTKDFAWSEDDWQRADQALRLVFEDERWPAGEVRFRQITLIEKLREAGVGCNLAQSLIDRLVARKVFRAGKRSWDLQIFVRLDGRQTDTATPDRLLTTSRQRWAAYLAEQRSASRGRAGRKTRPRTPPTAPRDQRLEARDDWIYHQCCNSHLIYRKILSELHKLCLQKGWSKIASIQGLRSAAKSYACRHHLPMPLSRQNL